MAFKHAGVAQALALLGHVLLARGTSTVTINLVVDYLTVSLPTQTSYSLCQGANWTVVLPNPVTSVAQNAVTYQWYGPTGAISGATTKNLQLNSVSLAQSGDYYCIAAIGNTSCGSPTTASTQSLGAITLHVNRTPVVSTTSANQNICPGTTF